MSYPSRPASTLPSVDLPAPFGPMIACTWPGATSSERPLRMSRPPMRTWRLSIFNIGFFRKMMGRESTDRAFERNFQQLLRLDGEFHRQLAEHGLAETVD